VVLILQVTGPAALVSVGNIAVEMADRIGDGTVVGIDQLAQILRDMAGGQRGRADQITEHHRQLTAFGINCGTGGWSRYRAYR
jgi:hypothetical protein